MRRIFMGSSLDQTLKQRKKFYKNAVRDLFFKLQLTFHDRNTCTGISKWADQLFRVSCFSLWYNRRNPIHVLCHLFKFVDFPHIYTYFATPYIQIAERQMFLGIE